MFQLGFQWIVHLSEKTLNSLHMQHEGSSVIPFISGCFLIKRNKISKTGSPWQAPLSSLKYWVFVLAFMTIADLLIKFLSRQ